MRRRFVVWFWTMFLVFSGTLPYFVGNKHWLLMLLSNLFIVAVLWVAAISARRLSRRA